MFRPQVARSARTLGRRANSTTAQQAQQKAQQAAQDAKQAAGDVAAKAKDALNSPKAQEVSQKANELFESGAQAVRKVTGPIGDKVGNALGCEYSFCCMQDNDRKQDMGGLGFLGSAVSSCLPSCQYGT